VRTPITNSVCLPPGGVGTVDWRQQQGSGLTQIAVGNANNVFALSSAGTMKWNGGGWTKIATAVKAISADEDQLYGVDGVLSRISVRNDRELWGVSSNGQVWKWSYFGWDLMPGGLADISVGSDGALWGVAYDGSVWQGTVTVPDLHPH
jgi:hypothetical protein